MISRNSFRLVLLQGYNNSAKITHVKQANSLLRRVRKNHALVGLHYPRMTAPFRLVEIGDASHANKHTVYAQEANMVALMEDRYVEVDGNDHLLQTLVSEHGGPVHPYVALSSKSKRVSQSTSHAETLAALKVQTMGAMVAMRLTEVFYFSTFGAAPTLKNLLEAQEKALYIVPIDHYTDCHDMYDLVCGGKGIPQDKGQRLAILALREARLCGAVRRFYHIPTDVMLADALTKAGLSPLFMKWLTTGMWDFKLVEKPITCRITKCVKTWTEDDLHSIKDAPMVR